AARFASLTLRLRHLDEAVLVADLAVVELAERGGVEKVVVDGGRDAEILINAARVKLDLQETVAVVIAECLDDRRVDGAATHILKSYDDHRTLCAVADRAAALGEPRGGVGLVHPGET